jgi:TetR/AcrR family transcriptional regulator, transcriptional repressor for nem operon
MPIQKVTREEIIRLALDVFHRQGYHNTSMSDLAKACGLQKGSFYHYFASKDELMQAVLLAVRGHYRKKIFSIIEEVQTPVKERLMRIWAEQKATLSQQNGGCLFGNMALETANVTASFKTQLRAFFDDWQHTLTTLLSELYPPDQAARIARQSVMMMEGAAMMARLYENDDYLEEAFQLLLAFF